MCASYASAVSADTQSVRLPHRCSEKRLKTHWEFSPPHSLTEPSDMIERETETERQTEAEPH